MLLFFAFMEVFYKIILNCDVFPEKKSKIPSIHFPVMTKHFLSYPNFSPRRFLLKFYVFDNFWPLDHRKMQPRESHCDQFAASFAPGTPTATPFAQKHVKISEFKQDLNSFRAPHSIGAVWCLGFPPREAEGGWLGSRWDNSQAHRFNTNRLTLSAAVSL